MSSLEKRNIHRQKGSIQKSQLVSTKIIVSGVVQEMWQIIPFLFQLQTVFCTSIIVLLCFFWMESRRSGFNPRKVDRPLRQTVVSQTSPYSWAETGYHSPHISRSSDQMAFVWWKCQTLLARKPGQVWVSWVSYRAKLFKCLLLPQCQVADHSSKTETNPEVLPLG